MLALLLWLANREVPKPEPTTPDFSAINDVKTKKKAFFDYMLPLVQQSNKKISQERAEFLEIRRRFRSNKPLKANQTETLHRLAEKYRVTGAEPLSANAISLLDRRIADIPTALALAQAANESAWGTARFAVKGTH